ncbi:MAG: tetratricopeptide repeat protein [Candidatus Promineifilaceae bacterium]
MGFAVGALGWSLFGQSELEEATPYLLEAAKLDEETDQPEQEAWIYCMLAAAANRRSQFDEARRFYQRALNLAREVDDGRTISNALLGLGKIAAKRGKYHVSRRHLDEGLVTSRRHGIVSFEIHSLVGLGQMWETLGDLESAAKCLEEAVVIARAFGKDPLTTESLNALAHLRVSQDDYQAAQRLYDEAAALLEMQDTPEDEIQNLAGRGRLALYQGEYVVGERLYRDAVAMSHETGNRLDVGRALVGLGLALHVSEHNSEARKQLIAALVEGLSVESDPLLLDSMSALSVVLAAEADYAYAAQLAALVQRHYASTAETRNRATAVLDDVTPHLSSLILERIMRNESADIASVGRRLIADFSPPRDDALEPTPVAEDVTRIEPLSDRELQILRLVADGRSNREIGRELYVAMGTVKSHLQDIFQKLDVKSRTQAAARAADLNLL